MYKLQIKVSKVSMLKRFAKIFETEANAIRNIPVGDSLARATNIILNCSGKVFTTGLGKAGYIARKAASTFCTTGTPSVFLHPADASHGDVGVVASNDILIAFSNSGKTREVIETVGFCRRLGLVSVIVVTSCKDSPLGQDSDVSILIGNTPEACPLGLTPSSSTAAMTAVSDALAFVVMEEKGFTPEQFALRHHGGYLGEQTRDKLVP